MRRVLLLLVGVLAACAIACGMVYYFAMQTPADEWMGKRLGLTGPSLEQFTEAHQRYSSTCAEMCERIAESDARLAQLVVGGEKFTPEIAAAMARSDRLKQECRQNMLQHFYEVSTLLEPAQRRTYLELVLPLIVDPAAMSREHRHHE